MSFSSNQENGALASQTIKELISAGFISGAQESNVKPASLDLSISDEVYKVEGVFQPRPGEKVRDVLSQINKERFSLDQPLVRGQMYIARLNEKLSLPESVFAVCNPKSTSGRLDVHVRLIADGISRYDVIAPPGWKGEMWVSIVPKTFSVLMHPGQSLNQLRLFNADTRLDNLELEIAIKKYRLLWNQDAQQPMEYEEINVRDNDHSIILTIDLAGDVLGYEGIESETPIDLNKINHYDYQQFFKPITKQGGHVYLKKGGFYILSTLEAVRVPPELACEMVPMDERSGEFRSHYAGFIDPGWGWGKNGEGFGRPLTLEVRPFEDLIVRHGQPIAKIKFERVKNIPNDIYDSLPSNYLIQSGPRLAKHFKIKT